MFKYQHEVKMLICSTSVVKINTPAILSQTHTPFKASNSILSMLLSNLYLLHLAIARSSYYCFFVRLSWSYWSGVFAAFTLWAISSSLDSESLLSALISWYIEDSWSRPVLSSKRISKLCGWAWPSLPPLLTCAYFSVSKCEVSPPDVIG